MNENEHRINGNAITTWRNESWPGTEGGKNEENKTTWHKQVQTPPKMQPNMKEHQLKPENIKITN